MRTIATVLAASVLAFTAACAVPAEEPTAVQPAEKDGAEASPTKAEPAIKMTAKKIAYQREEFTSGGPYTCARVVVTNLTKGNVEVNPYGFAVTGVDGEKRQAAVGAAKKEFESLTLAPGEKASGTVCSETDVAPKVITFSEGLDETVRAEVG